MEIMENALHHTLIRPLVVRESQQCFRWEHRMGKKWARKGEPAPLQRGRVEGICGESGSGEKGENAGLEKPAHTGPLLPRGTLGCSVRGGKEGRELNLQDRGH